jgi:hypothetical protein
MGLTMIFLFGMVIMIAGYILLVVTTRNKQTTPDKENDNAGVKGGAEKQIVAATSLPLRGQPDFIRQEGGVSIPVIQKKGKTPKEPYLNHTMELMALCLVIHETSGIRPPGGIVKYPEKEFKVAFTQEAEASVRNIVREIQGHKRLGTEFACNHAEHNK